MGSYISTEFGVNPLDRFWEGVLRTTTDASIMTIALLTVTCILFWLRSVLLLRLRLFFSLIGLIMLYSGQVSGHPSEKVIKDEFNQSIIRLVLRHSVLTAQDNVVTTVKKMRLQQGFENVNRRCGPDFVGQMILQVRCCHRKDTITSLLLRRLRRFMYAGTIRK